MSNDAKRVVGPSLRGSEYTGASAACEDINTFPTTWVVGPASSAGAPHGTVTENNILGTIECVRMGSDVDIYDELGTAICSGFPVSDFSWLPEYENCCYESDINTSQTDFGQPDLLVAQSKLCTLQSHGTGYAVLPGVTGLISENNLDSTPSCRDACAYPPDCQQEWPSAAAFMWDVASDASYVGGFRSPLCQGGAIGKSGVTITPDPNNNIAVPSALIYQLSEDHCQPTFFVDRSDRISESNAPCYPGYDAGVTLAVNRMGVGVGAAAMHEDNFCKMHFALTTRSITCCLVKSNLTCAVLDSATFQPRLI